MHASRGSALHDVPSASHTNRRAIRVGFQFDVAAGLRSWAFGLGHYQVLGPFSVLRPVVQVPRTKDGRLDKGWTKNQATKQEGRRYAETESDLAAEKGHLVHAPEPQVGLAGLPQPERRRLVGRQVDVERRAAVVHGERL